MEKNEKFDSFWYEEYYRVSLSDMKLYHIQDKSCQKPFVVIGYKIKEMTFRRFKNKVRMLLRATMFLVVLIFIFNFIIIFKKNGPKFLPENSPFPDSLVDIGERYSKNLIFENGFSFLTKSEGGPSKPREKPNFYVITGLVCNNIIISFLDSSDNIKCDTAESTVSFASDKPALGQI